MPRFRTIPVGHADPTEHVEARRPTLAPESRHIVAFPSSGTTSRAAYLTPKYLFCSVNVRARITRARRGLRDSARRDFLDWPRTPPPQGGRREAKGRIR